jgi:hypothetical protein
MKGTRNRMAGKGKNSRPGSNLKTGRDYSYDKAYQKSPARVKYRTELNKANKNSKASKVGDGKDMSHCKNGKMVLEKASKNRARNGSGNRPKKK